MYNVLNQEMNKIALSSNDDKKNAFSWLDRNIRIWNEQRSSSQKRGD